MNKMSFQTSRLLRHPQNNFQSLSQNGAHQFALQHALSIYRSDAIYTFIPKNACSTMRYTVALDNGAIPDESKFAWIHENNASFRASPAEVAKAQYTFVILRDPFLRICSCYLEKMVSQKPVAWQYHTLTNYRTSPEKLTFRDFITHLKPCLRGNPHWRPQVDFLIYQNYDDFFCVEAFSEAVATLRQRIGLHVHDARDLSRHGLDQYEPLDTDEHYADQPAYAIAALKRSGKIPRLAQMYDASLIAEVNKMYAEDINFYVKTIGRPCVFPAA